MARSCQARGGTENDTREDAMSLIGENLIQSPEEALAHAKGEGPATVPAVLTPLEVSEQIKLADAQRAPLMSMMSGSWKLGAGEAAHKRLGSDASSRHRKRTRSCQARVAIPRTRKERPESGGMYAISTSGAKK